MWTGLKKCMPPTRSGCFKPSSSDPTRERRRVGRQHGVRPRPAVQLAEDGPLGVEVFDGRFDDDVHVLEAVPVRRAAHGGGALLGLGLRQHAPLDRLVEQVLDARQSRVEGGLVDLAHDDLEAPRTAASWAMPAPMTPAPTTPTRRTSGGATAAQRLRHLLGLLAAQPERDEVAAGRADGQPAGGGALLRQPRRHAFLQPDADGLQRLRRRGHVVRDHAPQDALRRPEGSGRGRGAVDSSSRCPHVRSGSPFNGLLPC